MYFNYPCPYPRMVQKFFSFKFVLKAFGYMANNKHNSVLGYIPKGSGSLCRKFGSRFGAVTINKKPGPDPRQRYGSDLNALEPHILYLAAYIY